MKILIVDDDHIVVLVQTKLLQRCGIQNRIISYMEGSLALEYLREQSHSQPVMILLDINMPQMNGWEFLAELKKLEVAANTFVIMVTSSIDKLDKQIASQYPNVIGFIEKPITVDNCQKIMQLPQISDRFRFA